MDSIDELRNHKDYKKCLKFIKHNWTLRHVRQMVSLTVPQIITIAMDAGYRPFGNIKQFFKIMNK